MVIGNAIFQNTFISDGNDKYIEVPADTVKIEVLNKTAFEQNTADLSAMFIWYQGYNSGESTVVKKLGNQTLDPLTAANLATGGIVVENDVNRALAAGTTVTNISTAAKVTSASHGLQTGDVARLSSITGAKQLEGIDFYVTRDDANNVTLTYFNSGAGAIVAAASPGASALIKKVNTEYPFKPKRTYIAGISKAAQAVVTVTEAHGYVVGQQVLMRVPAKYGMTQMDSQIGTIQAKTASTFTLDIDSSAFTAFSFPVTADAPFDFAVAEPYGDNLGVERANNSAPPAGTVYDNGMIRVLLTGGATGPGGAASDVIYWNAYQAINL